MQTTVNYTISRFVQSKMCPLGMKTFRNSDRQKGDMEDSLLGGLKGVGKATDGQASVSPLSKTKCVRIVGR